MGKQFKEALEIYVEDLPFEVNDLKIEFNVLDRVPYYFITYNHSDDRLKSRDSNKRMVTADVDLYFKRFAKKYDLEYVYCLVQTSYSQTSYSKIGDLEYIVKLEIR